MKAGEKLDGILRAWPIELGQILETMKHSALDKGIWIG